MLMSRRSCSLSLFAAVCDSLGFTNFCMILSFHVWECNSDFFLLTTGSSSAMVFKRDAKSESLETRTGTPAAMADRASVPRSGESSFKGSRNRLLFSCKPSFFPSLVELLPEMTTPCQSYFRLSLFRRNVFFHSVFSD